MSDSPSQSSEHNNRLDAAITRLQRDYAARHCLADGDHCRNKVIRAHSIQAAAIRDQLATDGHIYMFQRRKLEMRLARVGYNNATTFTGFCSSHDNHLFGDIDFDDARPFDLTSPRQQSLLALRAIAREYWAKLNYRTIFSRIVELIQRHDHDALATLLNIKPTAITHALPALQDYCTDFLQGTNESSIRIEGMFRALNQQVAKGRFHQTKFKTYEIVGVPTLAVSSIFAPEFDFAGQRLNTLLPNSLVTYIVLTVLPLRDKSVIAITYHRRHEPLLLPLLRQLSSMSSGILTASISKMILVHCENVVLAPTLVDRLTPTACRELENVFESTMPSARPYYDLPDVNLFYSRQG